MKTKIFILIFCVVFFVLPVYAEENGQTSSDTEADTVDSYASDSLDDFSRIIPEAADNLDGGAEQIADDFTIGHVVDLIAAELRDIVEPLTKQLAILLGTVILISTVNALKASFTNAGLTSALEYATLLCAALAAYNAVSNVWDRLSEALSNLTAFMTGLIPMMGALYIAGGNVTAATVSSAGLMTLNAFCEQLAYYVLWPVLRVCFGLALITGLGGQVNLTGVSQTLRNMFTTTLSFIMAILTAVLGYQTNLALSADNLSARALKFAASSYIPVVGGAVGDAIRAIGGSVGMLRATLGTASVAVVFTLVLPAVLQIYLCRLTFSLVSTASKLVGCDREGAFFEEMRGMLGFGLAILVSCTAMFLFFITLFARAAVGITQ